MSPRNSNNKAANKGRTKGNDSNNAALVVAAFGLVGTIITAYFSYRGSIEPTAMEIAATQRAESALTQVALMSITSSNTPLITLSATPTPTITITPLFTSTPILTSTASPTLPDYSLLKPRTEPSSEQNFVFFDNFSSDKNDWYFNAEKQGALMEVKDNTLQISLSNSHTAPYFLAGCTAPNCVVPSSEKENLTYKFRIRSIRDVPGVLAGIAFGSESNLSETTNFYLLLASNKGQIWLYSTSDGVNFNETKSLYSIPRDGAIDIQIDFYHKECPGNAERCSLIFVNDNLFTEKPIIINKPPSGYFGVYVLPGNTQGYIRTITIEYVKIWSEY